MINWNYMVIGLSLLLLIFVFWKEIKRKNKLRLAIRLVASSIAVAALACLALPVSMLKKIDTTKYNREAILLTEGFSKDSLDNFLKKNKAGMQVYQQDSLPWIDTEITALHIFGVGLSENELELIDDLPLIFHPSSLNDGIQALHWKQKLSSGEKLSVQGVFSNSKSWPVKIALDGFNNSLDSVIIPALQTQKFEVSTFPKHIGRAIYSIIISDDQGAMKKEPLPVEVKSVDSLHILVLAASPDFENKFLKNWLSENGMAVTTRTLISKNKYDKTFNNIPSFGFDKITNSLLSRFDIIISDASELASLTKAEQAIIHEQVQENGMGLIVKSDTIAVPSAFYASPFTQYLSTGKQYPFVRLYLKDAHQFTSPLAEEEHSFIRLKPGQQPIVLDSSQNIFVSSCLDGAGKILYMTIDNTYSWMLAGNSKDYFSFWSSLLQKAAKKNGTEDNWMISGAIPRPGEQVYLCFETLNPGLSLPQINNDQLSLQQNADLPFRWRGAYWPAKNGWQSATGSNNEPHEWYVYEKDDWKDISASERIRQTRQYINNKNNTVKKTGLINKYARVELPGLYFFLIFIISCGFLWIEKKLSAA